MTKKIDDAIQMVDQMSQKIKDLERENKMLKAHLDIGTCRSCQLGITE